MDGKMKFFLLQANRLSKAHVFGVLLPHIDCKWVYTCRPLEAREKLIAGKF
jgi:hypothetical protein